MGKRREGPPASGSPLANLSWMRDKDNCVMYADNEYKWVAVLNRTIPLPQLLNAISHLALGARNDWPEPAGHLHEYEDSDRKPIAVISHWPVIVLEAKNSNQLRALRSFATAAGFKCQAFANTMIGESADDQLQKTKASDEMNLDYYAVLLFGPSAILHGMTKKFSLFKGLRGHAQALGSADPD